MAAISLKGKGIIRPLIQTRNLSLSSSTHQLQRFGDDKGSSGWKWEKGGIGMGGKDAGKATEIKPDTGKGKTYQVPEYFQNNCYTYADIEQELVKQRLPQPKSGLTEFWTGEVHGVLKQKPREGYVFKNPLVQKLHSTTSVVGNGGFMHANPTSTFI